MDDPRAIRTIRRSVSLVDQSGSASPSYALAVANRPDDATWQAIESAHASGEPVSGRVSRAVEGGLILDLRVNGLLPWALIETEAFAVKPLEQYVGQQLAVKIIELNRSGHNVVVSRRAVLEGEA
jgi:small subunit ribosomal protein S1